MKYDCNKTLDYWHEYKRICDTYSSYSGCDESCPLKYQVCENPTAKIITIVQKWSDSHQEKPTLTREEYAFLKAFKVTADKNLERRVGQLSLAIGYASMELRPEMFSFIKEGETWFLGDLLKLEVQE